MWRRAVRWLAAHDRSEHELRRRLAAAGATPPLIEQTIRRLQELRYVDDRRFAEGVAERGARYGHGSEYVRAQLTMKGVAEALIEAAITAAFADERALAHAALVRRYPRDLVHPAERAKAARFLHQRGFPDTVVLAILGEGC